MILTVRLVDAAGRRRRAYLTTDHAASSYGVPVLLLDGEPLGPGDLAPGTWIEPPDRGSLTPRFEVTHWPIVDRARAAGYPVNIPGGS